MLVWALQLGVHQEGSRMAESHEQSATHPETGLLDPPELFGEG